MNLQPITANHRLNIVINQFIQQRMPLKSLTLSFFLLFATFQTTQAAVLTNGQIDAILQQIPALIEQHHVDRDRASDIAGEFRQRVESGTYHQFKDAAVLAKTVSTDLREISNDGHLYLKHIETSPDQAKKPAQDWEAAERESEIKLNYGFTGVQILENNTGYLKIEEWMHPKRSMPTAVAAMKLVENTNALIIDLRGNGGGYPGIMEYVLNHYFEGPPRLLSTTYFSDVETKAHTRYTSDLVHGKLLVGKPLYILIDEDTASASEYFAYTLQAFGKAVIVGNKSAGAANMNSFYPLNDQFRLSVSTAMPINPVTGTNWELTGVKPDIQSGAEAALQVALEHIKSSARE